MFRQVFKSAVVHYLSKMSSNFPNKPWQRNLKRWTGISFWHPYK